MGARKRVIICGVPVDNVSRSEAIETLETAITTGRECSSGNEGARCPRTAFFLNVDVLMKAQARGFRDVLVQGDSLFADGAPLMWAAGFLGTPLKARIPGSDLFPELCGIAAGKGYRLFFLGGRPGSAVRTAEVMRGHYPGLKVVGIYSPPFGFEKDDDENARIVSMVRKARPDILFVGLGAPKQEVWIDKYKEACRVPVSVAVGATFEITAGVIKRAPLWMRNMGLEWLWRLIMEPGRLWRRYLVDDMRFFGLVVLQKAKGGLRKA